MATKKGTTEPTFKGTGKRAGILGPSTKVQNTSEKKATSLQKGKAKGQVTGGKLAPNSTSGGNAKRFGQGKATDDRSAKRGN